MDVAKEIVTNSMHWINWVFFGVLALICFSKAIAPIQFSYYLKATDFDKYLGIFGRSNQPIFNKFNYCFFIIRQAVFAVFLINVISHFKFLNASPSHFWYLLLFLSAYWGFRYLIEYMVAFAIHAETFLKKIVFLRISMRNLIALILFILLCVVTFIPYFKTAFLYITGFLYVVMQLILIGVVIYSYRRLIREYFLYFILYLCAFEIIPLLILMKVFIEGKTSIL